MRTASETASRSASLILLGLLVVACAREAPAPPTPVVEVVRTAPIHFGPIDYSPPARSAPRQQPEVIFEGTPEEVQARMLAALQERGFRILVDDRSQGLLAARYKGPTSTYLDCGTVHLSDAELGPKSVAAVRDRLVFGLDHANGARNVETRDYQLQALITIQFRHHAASLAPGTRVTGSADYVLVNVHRQYRFDPMQVDGLGQMIAANGAITHFTSESGASIYQSRFRCVPSGELEWGALRG